MKLKHKETGRTYPASQAVWESIVSNGKGHLFDVVEHDEQTPVLEMKGSTEGPLTPKEKEKKKPGRPAKKQDGN
jgi:hypothetical protein